MEQTWLTVDELAAVLKVSPKSIRRAYRKGEIPVDRILPICPFRPGAREGGPEGQGAWSDLCGVHEEGGTAQRDRRRQPAARAADQPPTW
jgi:hypothetical protein